MLPAEKGPDSHQVTQPEYQEAIPDKQIFYKLYSNIMSLAPGVKIPLPKFLRPMSLSEGSLTLQGLPVYRTPITSAKKQAPTELPARSKHFFL